MFKRHCRPWHTHAPEEQFSGPFDDFGQSGEKFGSNLVFDGQSVIGQSGPHPRLGEAIGPQHGPACPHSQNGALGRVDDGRELLYPHHAKIGDGEGTPLELVGLQFVLLGPRGQVSHGAADAQNSSVGDVSDDGSDEARGRGHGNADVSRGGGHHLGAVPDGVDGRAGLQSHSHGLDEEVIEAHLSSFAPHLVPQGVEFVHLALQSAVRMRDARLGLREPLGDCAAHARHFDVNVRGPPLGCGGKGGRRGRGR